MRNVFAAILLAAASLCASAQTAPRREILILGTYHMANPGRDIYNTKADDVLTPKRQQEMTEVIETLKRFAPTKIVIEREPESERTTKEYGEYLAGTRQLSRNEIEQIGYRLAKELGHKQVYGADVDGEFPYLRLLKFAKATGRDAELEVLQKEGAAYAKAQDELLATHTVLETLLDMNSDASVARGMSTYLRMAELGEAWDWAGADLVASWYQRNIRIYSNIHQVANAPDDRILVIYGAGHLGWLQSMFAANPHYRVRKLAEFVR